MNIHYSIKTFNTNKEIKNNTDTRVYIKYVTFNCISYCLPITYKVVTYIKY